MAHQPPRKPVPKKPGAKASTVITITGIGIVSLLVVGACAAQDDYEEVGADCVNLDNQLPDGSYEVVDEDYCDDDGTVRYHGSHGAYGWYYGGTRTGTRVGRGTTVRPSDVGIVSRGKGTVIQRGGFGGRGSSGS
ncbi:hypothetical protein [Planomonospora sp. ID82291]|uniref:hypothetical protein n=1 Tax=Planomonospora sp. ID82291 TaxID=2738136 RepID=UPI001E42EA8D|nr:hypothetical protein [Planomonospora sp. ID82291]